ncbi:hypothetical protein, partial [uncultured Thiodictyon sp.]
MLVALRVFLCAGEIQPGSGQVFSRGAGGLVQVVETVAAVLVLADHEVAQADRRSVVGIGGRRRGRRSFQGREG